MRSGWGGLLLLVLLLMVPPPAGAGFVQHERGGEVTYVQEGKLKTVPARPDELWLIFDLRADLITMVDPAARRYAQGSSTEYCELVQGMMDAASSMLGALGLEMAKPAAPVITVRREGAGEKIAGFATTRYQVLQDGQMSEEVWLADDPALMKELAGSGSLARMECGGDKAALAASAEYARLLGRGWPLRSVTHLGQESYTSLDVIRIEQKKIPAAEFQPPAGYQRVGLAEFFAMDDLGDGGLQEMLKGLEGEGIVVPGFGR
ncbi:DUF4412 domain-containing protein [Desulfurivibrio sp. D14AmB]|uniref:DUF4412 domain-containing protein n=1 Tax=Desulfurivibrio sp. D14AmB TaxID=3374370 RepID=UPI00376F378B